MVGLQTLEEVEEAWKTFETTGFVHVSEPERHGLRPNRDAIPGTTNIYMISAHHQLHCLKKLHVAFTLLLMAARDNATSADADEKAMIGVRHAEHCWNYLRQGIVCAGDATLEGPSADGTLLGYGVRHQCRRWEGEGGLETYRRGHGVDHGL
ncbi:hypothetical protein C8A03DRAFT_12774 [Achaetomium macrosporum]|uniref:Uncharacterized protein n=1 Tax=Achaetomium macrosporum TaxID=79813 RepID=A0AAN7HGD7_9PEZI|nr:hypothetical protein C8A03DRAFT_12774 [Achaetomium macrosporum]